MCLFLSQKYTTVFQHLASVFQKCLLFIYCACLFPRMLFSCWLYFILVRLTTAERYVCLALVLFPLGALCWPTYDAFLKTLKRPHGVWFFCLFYSNFSIDFNLENTVSEYLKWLKMSESFNQDIALIKTFLWYKFDSVFQPLEKQNVCAYNIVWVHVFRTFLSEDRFSW